MSPGEWQSNVTLNHKGRKDGATDSSPFRSKVGPRTPSPPGDRSDLKATYQCTLGSLLGEQLSPGHHIATWDSGVATDLSGEPSLSGPKLSSCTALHSCALATRAPTETSVTPHSTGAPAHRSLLRTFQSLRQRHLTWSSPSFPPSLQTPTNKGSQSCKWLRDSSQQTQHQARLWALQRLTEPGLTFRASVFHGSGCADWSHTPAAGLHTRG